LLNNTPLYHNRDKHGFVTRPGGGGIAEVHIVVETTDVTWDDFKEGMRFFYALHALQNTRTLRAVRRYLAQSGQVDYADFFTSLVEYWRTIPDDPLVRWVEGSIESADFYDVTNYGTFVHMVTHSHRDQFNAQLLEFAQKQSWWADPKVQALFELDLVNRPYLYSNTPLDQPSYAFQSLEIVEQKQRGYVVKVDDQWVGALREMVKLGEKGDDAASSNVFYVDHRGLQYPYMATQSAEHHGGYCHGMVEKIENVTPTWTSI
jgi:hypothetical protein